MSAPFERFEQYKNICKRQGREVNWRFVSQFFILPEFFIEEHINDIYWEYILACQKLSEEFIRKHIDNIKWNFVSNDNIKISEDFIREFKDEIDWRRLNKRKLSFDFKREFFKELYLT